MSRHRGLMKNNMLDDADDYDDFDPMDDDEESEDYYIGQVIAKTGVMPKDRILKALESTSWNINAAVKLLLQKPVANKPAPNKPAPQTKQGSAPKPKNTPGNTPQPATKSSPLTVNSTKSPPVNPPALVSPEEAKPANKPKPLAHEEVKSPQKLNQNYPDVNSENPPQGKLKINLVVIGHVDAGKSTLMGHLLYLLGFVDPKIIHRYEKESRDIGKDSFHFAWVLDAGTEERQRGVTIDVGCSHFLTPNRDVTILDAPGHKDFIPNMISGAAQADAAILVIDASIGEFEMGFEGEGHHGQTKEHSYLARSLGINHIIVAVNKLDTVGWDQQRFLHIQCLLEAFLKKAGFKEVKFIPISGLAGINLNRRSEVAELAWYQGQSLVEMIDVIPQPPRCIRKPLRLCVMDSYKLSHGSIIGQVITGKIEGGVVRNGERIMIAPSNVIACVKHIEINGNMAEKAVAGETADLALKDCVGDFNLIMPGDVICQIDYPIPQIRRFKAKVFTFEILFPITKGMKLIMFIQSLKVTVSIVKLIEQIDGNTGKLVKSNPRCFTRNMAGIVEVEAQEKICIEKFANYKSLGRVLFRDRSETVMAGMVLELIE